MGDGPERGNTRIERLFREKAMKGAKAVMSSCRCTEVRLFQHEGLTRTHLDVPDKSVEYCKFAFGCVSVSMVLSASARLEFVEQSLGWSTSDSILNSFQYPETYIAVPL